MREVKNKKNIVYLAVGILTLIISTAGATYAYFTATDNEASTMTGNMAEISFDLSVTKMSTYDDDKIPSNGTNKRGIIPMSNSMVEYAVNVGARTVNGTSANPPGQICQDDNGNAVCQIYKINVENSGTAAMLLDGYVTLTNGSGTPTDLPNYTYANTETASKVIPYDVNYYTTSEGKTVVDASKVKNATTMRWAQVFCDESTSGVISNCTTVGKTTTSASKSTNGDASGITSTWTQILNTGTTEDTETINTVAVNHGEPGKNRKQLLTSNITTKAMISGSEYDVINKNFIRISNHDSAATGYKQSVDMTSALIYNEFLSAKDATANPVGSSASYTDSQVYYIVVWLSETGTNQTLTNPTQPTPNPTSGDGFFGGVVTFISAQGSEVTGTFSGYTSVTPDTKTS